MAEDKKVRVRPFKTDPNKFWMEYKVYQFFPEEMKIEIIGGGIEEKEHIEQLIKYLKRKKLWS